MNLHKRPFQHTYIIEIDIKGKVTLFRLYYRNQVNIKTFADKKLQRIVEKIAVPPNLLATHIRPHLASNKNQKLNNVLCWRKR